MSVEVSKATVLRYFLESHNAPYDLEVIDETGTPDYAERQKAWHRMEREAFPAKHFTVEDVIAEADKVVLRWSFRGIHAGEFWTPLRTVPATRKTLTLRATMTYRLEGGRIAEEWACIDWLDIAQQLGVVGNTAGG